MSTATAPATGALNAEAQTSQKAESLWSDAFRRLRRNRVAFASVIFLVLLALAAILVPILSPIKYGDQDYTAITQPPSWSHPMGTDDLGRDLFVRLFFGARISLTVGIVVQFVILLIGVPAGLAAGYLGGKVDTLIMRIVDILYAMPNLLFVIIIMTFLRGVLGQEGSHGALVDTLSTVDARTGGLIGVYIGLGLISWLTVARIVRAQVLSLKQKEFIEAARALGASHWQIMFRHLFPNTIAPIVVATTLGIPGAILYEAGISFIGLGVIPPMPSWGLMISESLDSMRSHPYMLIFPAAALSLTVLAFNFLGDGLRDAVDPWMKR
jgi:oligopeptide transport system permease protein